MNKSGIFSLEGFAYQIKVFVYYLTKLRAGSSVGYETFDDIALQKKDTDQQSKEDKLHTYNEILNNSSGITALQVKHTTLSTEDYEKVLFNWLILESSDQNIEKYILVVDKTYGNVDALIPEDFQILFEKIQASTKKSNALITRVKKLIKGDYDYFSELCIKIAEKYMFKEFEDIDSEIYLAYEDIFMRGGVKDSTYSLRIKELIKNIEFDILENILKKNSYCCEYREFRQRAEDICQCLKDDFFLPSFSSFKKYNKLDITDARIIESRQYLQLMKCNLPQPLLKEYLIFEEYYNSFKFRCLENLKVDKIGDIEITTFDNFLMAKAILQDDKKDTPINRLNETTERENSYADNTQIKKGSAIHLTKENTDPSKLISWEDEL